MRFHVLIVLITAFLIYGGSLSAQNDGVSLAEEDTFEIWLYGDRLSPETVQVFVKTNPGFGEEWQPVTGPGASDAAIHIFDHNRLMILSGFSGEMYFGQDIRENYVAIRVAANQTPSSIHTFYVLRDGTAHRLGFPRGALTLIEKKPEEIRRMSLANLIRPRPFRLRDREVYTEHIEAPVRPSLPGVQEVKWLEILFRQR